MSDELVVLFWVYLWYFLGFVYFVCGWFYGVQSWIYYGLWFVILGLLFKINGEFVLIAKLLEDKVEFHFKEEFEE